MMAMTVHTMQRPIGVAANCSMAKACLHIYHMMWIDLINGSRYISARVSRDEKKILFYANRNLPNASKSKCQLAQTCVRFLTAAADKYVIYRCCCCGILCRTNYIANC